VPRAEIDAWLDPAFFARVEPSARRVTLQWGEVTTTSLDFRPGNR
jgi:hypothetical protein